MEEKEELKLSIKNQLKTKKNRTKFITRCGMFSALSFVLYILKFPLPFFPPFLKVNFSNLAIIIGSLSLGPVGGMIICVARFILKFLFIGSDTMYVGELTDLLLSLLIMLPAALFYMFNHTKKGGFIGIVISFVSWIVSSLLINWLISMPFYINFFFGGDLSKFVAMIKSVVPSANENNITQIYLFACILPFNALVGFVSSAVTILTYKKISIFMKKLGV